MSTVGGFNAVPDPQRFQAFQQLRTDMQAAGIDPRAIAQQLASQNGGQVNPEQVKQAVDTAVSQLSDKTLQAKILQDKATLDSFGPPPFGGPGGPGSFGPGFGFGGQGGPGGFGGPPPFGGPGGPGGFGGPGGRNLDPQRRAQMEQRRQIMDQAFAQYGLNGRQVMDEVKQSFNGQRPSGPEQFEAALTQVLQSKGLSADQIASLESQIRPPRPF